MKYFSIIVFLGFLATGCTFMDGPVSGVIDFDSADDVHIATYNVHHWIGDDDEVDVARIASVIAYLDAEIIVMQEVDNDRLEDGRGRQEALAEMLGFRWAEIEHAKGTSFAAEGNALLVAPHVEVLEATGVDISEEGRDPRAFVDARLRVRGRTFHVIGAHLGLKLKERRRQVEAIARRVDDNDAATFVMGDLNEWNPLAATFGPLRDRLDEVRTARTFPAPGPMFRLDRIWAPDTASADAVVVRTPLSRQASDHLPVRATIRF